MKPGRLTLPCSMALAVALLLAAGQSRAASLPVNETATVNNAAATLTGTLDITKFVRQGGQIFAVGSLSGTLTDAAGNVLGTITNQAVRLPVLLDQSSGTCQILDLTLGPLHLDLLGLVVDLNQIHLTITAQSGPGNLLGNLLCAVANLLNGNGLNLGGLTALLNNILRAL